MIIVPLLIGGAIIWTICSRQRGDKKMTILLLLSGGVVIGTICSRLNFNTVETSLLSSIWCSMLIIITYKIRR